MRGWRECREAAPGHSWHLSFLSTPAPPGIGPLSTASALEALMDWFKSAQHACQVTATEWEAASPNPPNSTPILTVPLPRASLSRHPLPHQALFQLVTKKTWTGFGELPAQKAGQTAGLPASMPCATVLRRLGTSSGKGCPSLHGHGWFSVEDARARARAVTTASQLPLSSTACLWAGGRTSSTLAPSSVNIWHRVFQRIKLHYGLEFCLAIAGAGHI